MTVSGLVGRWKITTPNFLIVYCVCYLSTLKNRFVVKNCEKLQEVQFTKTSVCAYCTNEVSQYHPGLPVTGNSEVNNGRQIQLGAVFILFYFQFTSTLEILTYGTYKV